MYACKTAIVMPALNEAEGIASVISKIPDNLKENLIVVDNGSNDETGEIALRHGAKVILEKNKGYGAACLAGISEAKRLGVDIICFMDADSSDDPRDIQRLLDVLVKDKLDLVIGSRIRGASEKGALPFHARLGNMFATWILFMRFGYKFTDLGPLRVVSLPALEKLNMQDRNYGWTIEMQAKALLYGLAVGEVPVSYKLRIGKSKISGTIKGSVLAGAKILWVAGKYCYFK